MSPQRNLAAFTASGEEHREYPPYISINRNGDKIEITVRSPKTPDGECGETAMIPMSQTDFADVVTEIVKQALTTP